MTKQKRQFLKKKKYGRFRPNVVIRCQIDVGLVTLNFVSISATVLELFWKNQEGADLGPPTGRELVNQIDGKKTLK